MSPVERVTYSTDEMAAMFWPRPGTDDETVIREHWIEGVYRLRQHDVEGETVLDLGANIGAFTVWAALCGAHRVAAVEPDFDNVARMLLHLARNRVAHGLVGEVGAPQVVVHPAAVWSRHGVVPFRAEGARGRVEMGGGYDVDAVTLDELVAAYGHVGVVKMDVEGAEWPALAACSADTLGRIDVLVMEWHGPGMTGADPEAMADTFGAGVAKLAEHGSIESMGRPSVGGMLWWRRYT